MSNRIFRNGRGIPRTITDRAVSGALLPGTAVFIGATLTQATSASGGRLALLGDRDYFSAPENAFANGPDPLFMPYKSGDNGVAYLLQPGQEYQWAMAAGTYTFGQELTVGAAGRLTAAATGNVVVAHLDQPAKGFAAGELGDVVIAGSYAKV